MLDHKAVPPRSLVSLPLPAWASPPPPAGPRRQQEGQSVAMAEERSMGWPQGPQRAVLCLPDPVQGPRQHHRPEAALQHALAALLGALKMKRVQLLALTLCLVLLAAPRLPVLGRKQRVPRLLLWQDAALTKGSATSIKRAAGLQPPPGFHLPGLGGPGWQPPAFLMLPAAGRHGAAVGIRHSHSTGLTKPPSRPRRGAATDQSRAAFLAVLIRDGGCSEDRVLHVGTI